MAEGLWREIGHQFRHPTGRFGRVMGRVMTVINRRPNKFAIDALKIAPADVVLELGCGPGAAIKTMAALANRGKVHGIDQSLVMLAQAAERNKDAIAAGRVSLHQCSFDHLPLPDASVDKILAVNVIYFWTDMQAVLTELRRVLRPGGVISIYATDASAMRNWKFASADTHRLFDTAALSAALESSVFARENCSVMNVVVDMGVRGLLAVVKTGAAKTANAEGKAA
jgi:ubiquinone/menaquinone biosynthesis C-methylase UbiE